MELLFTGPTLRPFNFTFKLSARGTKDRDQILQIIRFFKQGMAAQRTASQLFLKAPNTFKIRYLHKAKDHPYINYIKECALQSFTVNYTPEGNYMTFGDGLMTSYEITMQFQELEPIFNDDYSKLPGGNTDTVIGY
jgi:secreted Zn-dependent insulinase-like peptidase